METTTTEVQTEKLATGRPIAKATPSGSKIFDEYKVKITLGRDMLATNPCDPTVLDTHILERQRKLIMEKSNLNATVNKYLNQVQITKEKGAEEVDKIFDKLEEITGYKLTSEEREQAMAGKLDSLKETFEELDTKGTTVFFWNKEKNLPCIGDHMIYGFLKAATDAIGRTLPTKKGTVLHSASYTQSIINMHVRCAERFITSNRDIKRDAKGEPQYLQRSLRVMTAQGPRVTLAKSEVLEAGASFEFTLRVLKNSPMKEEHLQQLFQYGEFFAGLGQWRNAGFGQFSYEMERVHDRATKSETHATRQ